MPQLFNYPNTFSFRSPSLHRGAERVDTDPGQLVARADPEYQLDRRLQEPRLYSPPYVLRK